MNNEEILLNAKKAFDVEYYQLMKAEGLTESEIQIMLEYDGTQYKDRNTRVAFIAFRKLFVCLETAIGFQIHPAVDPTPFQSLGLSRIETNIAYHLFLNQEYKRLNKTTTLNLHKGQAVYLAPKRALNEYDRVFDDERLGVLVDFSQTSITIKYGMFDDLGVSDCLYPLGQVLQNYHITPMEYPQYVQVMAKNLKPEELHLYKDRLAAGEITPEEILFLRTFNRSTGLPVAASRSWLGPSHE